MIKFNVIGNMLFGLEWIWHGVVLQTATNSGAMAEFNLLEPIMNNNCIESGVIQIRLAQAAMNFREGIKIGWHEAKNRVQKSGGDTIGSAP
jgi:hypothetical protein